MTETAEPDDRRPSPALVRAVAQLFAQVARVDDDEIRGYLTTPHTSAPSAPSAIKALGLDPTNYARWAKGDPDRAARFTDRLLEVLQGDFHQISDPHLREVASLIWSAASRRNEPLIAAVFEHLDYHRKKLQQIDDAEAEAETQELLAHLAVASKSYSPSIARHSDGRGAADVGSSDSWSEPWTARQVGGWARSILRKSVRVAYVYGARRSGKSRLIAALRSSLARVEPSFAALELNVGDLVSVFRQTRSRRATHQALFSKLLRQLAPTSSVWTLPARYDFDATMFEVLRQAEAQMVSLIIANSDACLRITDIGQRNDCIDATKQLFSFLRPLAEECSEAPLDRMSVVLEGSRPLADVANTYPASPLSVGRSFILDRLESDDCRALARLASLNSEEDMGRLFADTGGHRSLIWAALSHFLGEGDGYVFPPDLASLPIMASTLNDLSTDLMLQPELSRAFVQLGNGEAIALEPRTRLQHGMFVAAMDPPRCGCPLLERTLLRALGQLGPM